MGKKTEAEIALEVYESVKQSSDKQKKLRSSTFWKRFGIERRTENVVERIMQLLKAQQLNLTVKSGAALGEENDYDWIILSLTLLPQDLPNTTTVPVQCPDPEWFQAIQTRGFESEREVETYFMVPLLEKLGYDYGDIFIGCPVDIFKGTQKTVKEADIVIFKDATRDKKDILLLVEGKNADKGINSDHVGQAKSYARELLPACYIVSNGQQIKLYHFNGMLIPDQCMMDFNRSELREKWAEFYSYVSKEATSKRKLWMEDRIKSGMVKT